MKKIVTILLMIILIYVLVLNNLVYASSSATYFSGETIKLEDTSDEIEIVSNEILIDTTTSKIKNTFLLNNTSNREITTTISIPLENKDISTTVHDLSILINSTKVEYTKENGEYSFKTILSAKEAKKIEIMYSTDNDLQNAKVIKYNLDNFGEKVVGKVKVDIIIDEKDIPLVTGIYPGHYTFTNNTISVEYYNFKANTITRNVIIEKETYKDLLYGQEHELTESERYILQNIDNLLINGVNIDYEQNYYGYLGNISENIYNTIKGDYDEDYYRLSQECNNILNYVVYKQILKDGMEDKIFGLYSANIGSMYEIYNILVDELITNSIKEYELMSFMYYDTTKVDNLKGKKICVDFVETENLDLYVNKVISGKGVDAVKEYVKENERKILKTDMGAWAEEVTGSLGAKVIFVGEGVDGESLNATEEEKIEYINSINADIYIRIMIYDGKKQVIGGYYNNSDLEMVKKFFEKEAYLNNENYFNYYNELKEKYVTYENYCNNYQRDFLNDSIIKLSNENVVNKCEVPTIAKFIGRREKIEDKYVVDLENHGYSSYNGSLSGIVSVNNALETEQAQKLLKENKQKNENIKQEIENKISKLNFNNNEAEIQERLQENISEDIQESIKNDKFKLQTIDIVIFSVIGVAIIICIIALIITHKRRKRGI